MNHQMERQRTFRLKSDFAVRSINGVRAILGVVWLIGWLSWPSSYLTAQEDVESGAPFEEPEPFFDEPPPPPATDDSNEDIPPSARDNDNENSPFSDTSGRKNEGPPGAFGNGGLSFRGSGSNFGGGSKSKNKVEFRLVHPGNPRYNIKPGETNYNSKDFAPYDDSYSGPNDIE